MMSIIHNGLEWQQIQGAHAYRQAVELCPIGWRIPTKEELLDIVKSRRLIHNDFTLTYTWSSSPADEGFHYFVSTNREFVGIVSDEFNAFVCYVKEVG